MKTSKIKVLIGANRVSPTLQNLQIDAVSNGATPYLSGDHVIYPIFEKFLTLDIANAVVAEGGGVEDFEVFFEISSVDDSVPAGVPDYQYIDEDENTQTHTWVSWCKPTHQPVTRDGRIFVSCISHGGVCNEFSEIAGVTELNMIHKNDIPSEESPLEM